MYKQVLAASVFLSGAVLAVTQTVLHAQNAGGAADTPQVVAVPEPSKMVITQAVPYMASPIPLADIRLTGGPLKMAQEVDANYLLSLDPDRMLFFLRQRAGLEPKAQQGYGGWDGAGRQLTGHIAGHYLSAVSYMFAATGDKRFKDRVDYIVKEMDEIQAAQKDGYIGGLMGNAPGQRGGGGGGRGANVVDGKKLFEAIPQGTIRSGGFDLNGMWSPWYVEHKIFSGLRDAYRVAGNKEALEVEKKFAAWVETIVGPLNQQQDQQMLATEYGGINESLACLYADTGDKRWLTLSDKFEHQSIVTPLSEDRDILANKHGNTLVPQLLGDLMRYVYSGNKVDGEASKFFWNEVALHHSFATGGHGRNEYFGQPDKFVPMLDGRTAESCNVYNMLKITREMFSLQPDVKYVDFQERALFNHVLASINPRTGGLAYMVPVGQNVAQEYRDNAGFTCCVGTGMENHALHGYGVYYTAGSRLWVNLFAPSVAEWKEQGVKLEMETTFPEGETATLKVTAASPKELTVSIRRPYWAGDGYSVKVNGEAVADIGKPDSYVDLKRTWKTGDTVSLTLPKVLRKEVLPDDANKAALMWGPLVLAAEMGGGGRRGGGGGGGGGGARGRGATPPPGPIFVGAEKVGDWLQPVSDQPGTFHASATNPQGGEVNFNFIPFYRMHDRQYGIYFDVMTPEQFKDRGGAIAAAQAAMDRLKAATVGFAQPGQMQTERDFNYQAGDDTQPLVVQDKAGRRATSWFSMDVPVEDTHPMVMIVTYSNEETARRTFDVDVDGTKVGEQVSNRRSPEEQVKFTDVEYKLPADLVKGKTKVTVKFQAANGSEVGGVFGIRMVRGDAER